MNEAERLQSENDALRTRIRELEQRLHHARSTASFPPYVSPAVSDYFTAFHETTLAIMNRLELNDVLEAIVDADARK